MSAESDEKHSGTTSRGAEATSDSQVIQRANVNQPMAAPLSFVTTITDKWRFAMDSLRKAVTQGVLILSHHAATNPIRYVVGICLFAVSILGIGYVTNFDMSVTAMVFLTPTHSVIVEQREWIEDKSNFPPKPHSLRILIHKDGENVVGLEGASRTFDVLDQIKATDGYTDLCEESEVTNTAGFMGVCHVRGLPMLWNHSRDIFQDRVTSNVDLLLQISADKYPDGSDIDPRELMGHMQILNGTLNSVDIVETAESFLMEVMVPAATDGSKQIAIDVLGQLLRLRSDWTSSGSPFQLETYLLDHSLESETTRAVFRDLPLIPSVFVIMAIFTCFVFSVNSKNSGKKCETRFLLGFGAVATVLISLATSYGLLWTIGVPFTSITQILPFIMFGIGLDDAFIIHGEYVRTDESKDPVERVRDTLEEVGLSISLTTLTTALAFGLGMLSSIPQLIWCAMYAFPTVIIDFIYQITFFVAIIVIDERRIAAKRKKANEEEEDDENEDYVGQAQGEGKEEAPSKVVKTKELLEHYTSSPSLDPGPSKEHLDPCKSSRVASERQSVGDNQTHQLSPGTPSSGIDRFMESYANVLLTKPAKILVLISFVAVTALCAFSTSRFTQEFNLYEVLMEDSYVSAYYVSVDEYAETGFILPEVYFRNVDQSDPEIQGQMVQFIKDLVNDVDAITEEPKFFWLWQFQDFLTYDDRLLDLTFNQQVNIFLSVDVFKILYGDHIVRDDETGDIIASRVVIHMDNIDVESVQNQIDAWAEQLSVTEEQPINAEEHRIQGSGFNVFIHEENMIYYFELTANFVNELINSSVAGVMGVTIVAFLFLPHWSAAFFLCPLLSVLYIDLIGFLQACEVHLNIISYFTLIISIGLLIDFNMHILVRYYESPCKTRQEKVKDSLQTMGSSVLIGGISTFLGVVPLLFSTSSFMKNLFYGFWGMVVIGCGHGLIVLPVVLSYIGPEGTYAVQANMSKCSARNIEERNYLTIQPTSDSSARAHPQSEFEDVISDVSLQKQPTTNNNGLGPGDQEASPLVPASPSFQNDQPLGGKSSQADQRQNFNLSLDSDDSMDV